MAAVEARKPRGPVTAVVTVSPSGAVPEPYNTIWQALVALLGNKPLDLPYELIKYD